MLSPCISVTYSILLAHQNTICAFPNMPEDFTPLYLSFSFPLAKIWFSPQGIAHMAFFLGIAQTQNVKPRRTLWAPGHRSLLSPFSYRRGASLVAQRLKHLPAMQETRVRSLGQEDSLGEGNGNPLQYSCLENPMDGRAWWATVHRVANSRTRLSDFTFSFHFHFLIDKAPTSMAFPEFQTTGLNSC